MTGYDKDDLSHPDCNNECCIIAESIMEEIHLLTMQQMEGELSRNGRHKGYLRRELLRRIRQAKEIANF
jgi:hypothetical protein